MTDGHACIRHIFPDHQSQFGKVTDPVVHEEHLSVSAHLELDGIGNHLFVEGVHLGIDGIAVGRWCLDDTHVASAHQRELKGSLYRCGGHSERIHIGLHLAQLLLGRDTELLFLINDEQTQVLKLHRLTDEFMRTDDDINLSFLQVTENLLGLLGTAGTREILHPYRHTLQTTGEGLVMLIGQYGGGHHHCHLLRVASRLERRADGHLGLTEAYIAAHQTVHRSTAFHIGLHIIGRLQLVGRILIEEARLQLMLQERVGTESKALLMSPCGIQFDQVAGNILDLGLGALLHAVPRARSQSR